MLLVNGVVLLASVLFAGFLITGLALLKKREDESWNRLNAMNGGDVLKASSAVDLSSATPLSPTDISESRLKELEGKAVALDAPQAVDTLFPVPHWIARATGKKQPGRAPDYFVLQASGSAHPGGPPVGGPPPGMGMPGMIDPRGGPALTIIPADAIPPTRHQSLVFKGVIRPLESTDRSEIEGLLRGHGLQDPPLPYVLDCLNVGAMRARPAAAEPASVGMAVVPFLFMLAALAAGCGWNVYKAGRRLKDPRLHPVFTRLGRFGNALDLERQVEADRLRGVQQFGSNEVTANWLLVPTFWGLDVVPTDAIVWIFQPRKVRFRRNAYLINLLAEHTRIALDRLGKQHVVRASPGVLDGIVAAVTRNRPWMEVGDPNPLREHYGLDKAGFIAAVEARRQQMTGQAPIP